MCESKGLSVTTSTRTSCSTSQATATDLEVRRARGRQERRRFLLFPWRVYKDDPLWVPPVLSERADRIDPEKELRFARGEAEIFGAWRGRRPVGTIGVAVDTKSSEDPTHPIGDCGFFECVEDRAGA